MIIDVKSKHYEKETHQDATDNAISLAIAEWLKGFIGDDYGVSISFFSFLGMIWGGNEIKQFELSQEIVDAYEQGVEFTFEIHLGD